MSVKPCVGLSPAVPLWAPHTSCPVTRHTDIRLFLRCTVERFQRPRVSCTSLYTFRIVYSAQSAPQ